VLARLGRAVRRVKRETGAEKLAALGYCMGGTLTTIYAAQHPQDMAALITLAAPIDFQRGGQLRCMVEPRWFDADAIADAGNVAPVQMQAGFVALRPTIDLGKIMSMPELATDARARESFLALDEWASDNIPFPGEAYRRYIRDLYQDNQLVEGTHRVGGKPVSLGAIACPTLVITASRDSICPPLAATALLDHVSTSDKDVLEVPGGHVGAVVGSRAAKEMYPALIRWLTPRLAESKPKPDKSS
jgi:polyhydroxyalkanoate synthase